MKFNSNEKTDTNCINEYIIYIYIYKYIYTLYICECVYCTDMINVDLNKVEKTVFRHEPATASGASLIFDQYYGYQHAGLQGDNKDGLH